ncbi:hypothetical protein PSTT_11363, partial [Puccinia striiformis]
AGLNQALATINEIGTFAAWDALPGVLPTGLYVDGVGDVGVPLNPEQLRQLIEMAHRAPLGPGSETPLDDVPAVGNTWEISADRVEFLEPAWQGYIPKLSQLVATKLGIDGSIRLQLDKMVLYGQGAMSKPQIESTERIRGMFGTLMLCLPSICTGGEVLVKYNSESMVLGSSDGIQSFACWYSDVAYEVLPVQSGYRCVLVYNMAIRPGDPRPSASAVTLRKAPILDTFGYWRKDLANNDTSDVPNHIYHMLDHHYTEPQTSRPKDSRHKERKTSKTHLSLERLNARDSSRVLSLQCFSREVPLEIFLALLEKQEIGPVNRPYENKRNYNGWDTDSEASYHELDEVEKLIYVVKSLCALDGTVIASNCELDLSSFLVNDPFEGLQASEDPGCIEAATHRTRRWALVIVPREKLGEYLARCLLNSPRPAKDDTFRAPRPMISDDLPESSDEYDSSESTDVEYPPRYKAKEDCNSALRYLGQLHLGSSAQRSMLDAMCKLYVSTRASKMRIQDLLKVSLQYSHYTLFQTVGVGHRGRLQVEFFEWVKEWLKGLSEADHAEKCRTWIPLLIQGYPSMSEIIGITDILSSTGVYARPGAPSSGYSTWAQDSIRRCITHFLETTKEPSASDGELIVSSICGLDGSWQDKSALLTSIVERFPHANATAFLIAILCELKTQATSVDLLSAAITELYRSLSSRVFDGQRKLSNIITKSKVKSKFSTKGVSSRPAWHSHTHEHNIIPILSFNFEIIVTPEALVQFASGLNEMSTDGANVLDPFIHQVILQCDTLSVVDLYDLWIPFFCQLIQVLVSRSVPLDTPIYQKLTREFIRHLNENMIGPYPQAHSRSSPDEISQWENRQKGFYRAFIANIHSTHLESLLGADEAGRVLSVASLPPTSTPGLGPGLAHLQGYEADTDYRAKLKADLNLAFQAIDTTGAFAAWGTIPTTPPAYLHVDGIGHIGLPLVKEQVRQLIAIAHPAPSGLGSKTPKIWKIGADRLEFLDPAWQGFQLRLSQNAAHKLGIVAPIRMQLDNMLIYDKGATSKPQTDSNGKTHGMFGTLLLFLPSTTTGGEVLVKFNGNSMLLGKTDTAQSFACWHSDVSYEVLPIQSGYQCVLTYNLAVRPDQTRPTASALDMKGAHLRSTLEYWHRDLANSDKSNAPSHLYYPLDEKPTPAGNSSTQAISSGTKTDPFSTHNRTAATKNGASNTRVQASTLSPKALKDVTWARSLQGFARGLPFEMFVAILEKEESGPIVERERHCYDRFWEDRDDSTDSMASFHELHEVEMTVWTVRSLSSFDGKVIASDFKYHSDFCVGNPFKDVKPVEEYDVESAAHRYYRSALVVVPHEKIGEYLAQCTFGFKYDLKALPSPYEVYRSQPPVTDGVFESPGSKDYDAALDFLGKIRSLPSAQMTMLDAMCPLYVSQHSEKLKIAGILKSALQHSHYTLFQTVGIRHEGRLPLAFFDWAKEWLGTLSDADRADKYHTWLPLLIQGYPSLADITVITEKMAKSDSNAAVPEAGLFSYDTWARDTVRRCIENFPETTRQPTTSDGKMIVTIISGFKEELPAKSALLTSIVERFPQTDATAFLLATLCELKTRAAAANLPINVIAELYGSLSLRIFNHKRKLSYLVTEAKTRREPFLRNFFSSSSAEVQQKGPSPNGLVVTPGALVQFVCDLNEMSTNIKANFLESFFQQINAQLATFSIEHMRQLWIPFLCQLISALVARSIPLKTPIYQQLTRHFIKHLDDTAIGPRPQKLKIPIHQVKCQCGDCVELNQFLKNTKQSEHQFKIVKAKRVHLEKQIGIDRVPCICKTVDTGSPHILIVTKIDVLAEKMSKWKILQGEVYAPITQKVDQKHLKSLLGTQEATRIQSSVKAFQAAPPAPAARPSSLSWNGPLFRNCLPRP